MYSTLLDEVEYDPLLVTFMAALGESLHTRSQTIVLEGLLRQIVNNVNKKSGDIVLPQLDFRSIIGDGLQSNVKRSEVVRAVTEQRQAEEAAIASQPQPVPGGSALPQILPTGGRGRGGAFPPEAGAIAGGRGRGRGFVPGPPGRGARGGGRGRGRGPPLPP